MALTKQQIEDVVDSRIEEKLSEFKAQIKKENAAHRAKIIKEAKEEVYGIYLDIVYTISGSLMAHVDKSQGLGRKTKPPDPKDKPAPEDWLKPKADHPRSQKPKK